MAKKRKFDVRVEYILRVQATSEDDALDAVNDLISPLPEEYVSRTLSIDVEDEEEKPEPEYNPEDKWDRESPEQDANGYSEEPEPPEQDEAPIDSYDYVRDDLNFDANREREREF